MKLIGHVSTAVIAAAPFIYFRHALPAHAAPWLTDYELLWWTGLFAAAPDLDILLSRVTPLKHRGYASHSLLTALVLGAVVLGLYWGLVRTNAFHAAAPGLVETADPLLDRVLLYFCPLTAFLAFLGVLVHLLGDSLTKTGVPILLPNRMWHFPVIGGRASFDNYFLNAIPLFVAGLLVVKVFGYPPASLRRFGHLLGDLRRVF